MYKKRKMAETTMGNHRPLIIPSPCLPPQLAGEDTTVSPHRNWNVREATVY